MEDVAVNGGMATETIRTMNWREWNSKQKLADMWMDSLYARRACVCVCVFLCRVRESLFNHIKEEAVGMACSGTGHYGIDCDDSAVLKL